jgi:hypothetical protein
MPRPMPEVSASMALFRAEGFSAGVAAAVLL